MRAFILTAVAALSLASGAAFAAMSADDCKKAMADCATKTSQADKANCQAEVTKKDATCKPEAAM